MTASLNKPLGIVAGIMAGALWGLPFVAPFLLPNQTPLTITFGRFLGFGLASLLWLVLNQNSLALIKKHWPRLVGFSILGFTLYSFVLFWGVSLTDPVVSSLIIGLLPVTIALVASRGKKLSANFWIGLALCVAGIFVSQIHAILGAHKWSLSPFGVFLLVLCLGLWTSYAVLNSRFLQKTKNISSTNWSCALGIISLILILPFFLYRLQSGSFVVDQTYLWVSLGLGFGSSWLANVLWNYASKQLPSPLLGPLITSETFFGVLYGHCVGALPWSVLSFIALALMIGGVVTALRSKA